MDRFDQVLADFERSVWGRATETQAGAAGLCLRATLALLATLETEALADGIELWNLTGAVPGRDRGSAGHGTHWVLLRDGEVIDVSARQFDADANHIRRCRAADEFTRWGSIRRVDPDGQDAWPEGLMAGHGDMPPWWRDLLKVGPPGDLPGWKYPRHLLDGSSPWYSPEPESQ